ncbi:MAG: hypothetical protein HY562_02540 [Ignavibacteriales bacterium]|nr:hypothetical protein [Ignavibacteriales bacterium]
MDKKSVALQLLVVVAAAFCIGCFQKIGPPEEPNIFSLSITIPDAGQDYFVGNDSLTVITYKMLIDSIFVTKGGLQDERFEPRLRLASYVFGFADYYVIASGQVGGGKFNGVRFSVVRPPLLGSFDDPDLIERDNNGMVVDSYSISLTGVYNRKFFRFRSRVSRTVEYGFSSDVNLADVNGYLEARLRGNWKQWFLNSAGNGILDPENPINTTQIEENILKYFDIFTVTFGEVQQ